jgi:hypothetical protein
MAADVIAQIERELPDAWLFLRPGFDHLPSA